jgi:carbon-monoxide dehydrogenase small subunit
VVRDPTTGRATTAARHPARRTPTAATAGAHGSPATSVWAPAPSAEPATASRPSTTQAPSPSPATGAASSPSTIVPGGPGAAPTYELTVNGVRHRVEGARLHESLLYVLRERLGLVGAKNACEQGECGSCSVLLDGDLVCACLELAATVAATGSDVVTVEGLVPPDAEPADGLLTDVQRAMVEAGGVQCGFCTPGLVMAIHDLLASDPEPNPLTVREALAGNLCRCTGYGRILAAVEAVVAARTATGRSRPIAGRPEPTA